MTEQKNELFGALALAQAEFLPVKKNAENPYFGNKYADLAAIRESTTPALSKHGLAIMQLVVADEQYAIVETYLGHKSGQSISSTVKLKPTKPDPQGFGSAITYARRYGLGAMLGLASEEEDDGNAASDKVLAQAKPKTPAPAINSLEVLTSQLDKAYNAGLQADVDRFLDLALAEGETVTALTQERASKVLSEFIKFASELKKEKK